MAPARAGAARAKLRSSQLVTESPPDAAAKSALNALVTCVSPGFDGPTHHGVLSALLEEVISVSDDFPFIDSQTWVSAGPSTKALLLEVLDGSATLPGLSEVAPECEGDVVPWVRPAAHEARVCALRHTLALTRCALATQCGELHAAALLHLRADKFASRDDYGALLDLTELPLAFRTGVTSRCCFHRRVLMYLKLAYRDGHVEATVAAGGLEFAGQTLARFATCSGAALNVARYVGVAGGQGRERRALQTDLLPNFITFLKETIKRADEDEDEDADARGSVMSNTDAAWTAVSQAFMSLAGCYCDEKPHPAGGSACVPQPQVVEELLKAGLPRLYLSRAVALAQHAHELAKLPDYDRDDGWLALELRMLGHVFRACVLFAATPRQRDTRLLMTLVAALRANAHVGQLQLWALRYCFVPLAYAEITRKKGGNTGHAFVRAGCRACRLECCSPLRSMGNAPKTLAALHAAGALPVVLAAAEQHRGCRRFAARLLAYLTQGDMSARRLLSELDAAAVMLRIHADELPRTLPAYVFSTLKRTDAAKAFETAQQGMLQSSIFLADTDAAEPSAEDGCSLSECDCDNDDTFGIITEAEMSSTDNMLARAQDHAVRYRSRIQLLTRAICALTDAPDVKSAATARAAAAADDVMAELLREEEAEKSKASKKKKKKSKAPKAKAAVEDSEASDRDDEEETAEAVGVETLVAGVMRATLAAPPPPFRSPAAAAAAQPPPPPVAKPKSSKAKAKAKAPPAVAAPSQSARAEPPPAVAMPPMAPPFLPPMAQAPMLPPLPPLQSQAALHAAPSLPPLPLAAPHAMFAAPLARASSAADELFPWLAQGSPEPAGPFADVAHDDDGLCIVCLDEPRSTALPGCADAHAPVLCAGCVALLRRGNAPACPLCRAPLLVE